LPEQKCQYLSDNTSHSHMCYVGHDVRVAAGTDA